MRPAIVICPGEGWQPQVGGICASCGQQLVGRLRWFCRASKWFGRTTSWCRDLYMANHDWNEARRVALWRAAAGRLHAVCIRMGCGAIRRLEVNHIEPRNGQGYQMGCHHHQDGLEVLCHEHHMQETRRQRGWKQFADAAQALMPLEEAE